MSHLAYFDSFAGLVPCRVLGTTTTNPPAPFTPRPVVRIEITAARDRGPYRQGDVIDAAPSSVVARDRVRGMRSMRGPRIMPTNDPNPWPPLTQEHAA